MECKQADEFLVVVVVVIAKLSSRLIDVPLLAARCWLLISWPSATISWLQSGRSPTVGRAQRKCDGPVGWRRLIGACRREWPAPFVLPPARLALPTCLSNPVLSSPAQWSAERPASSRQLGSGEASKLAELAWRARDSLGDDSCEAVGFVVGSLLGLSLWRPAQSIGQHRANLRGGGRHKLRLLAGPASATLATRSIQVHRLQFVYPFSWPTRLAWREQGQRARPTSEQGNTMPSKRLKTFLFASKPTQLDK